MSIKRLAWILLSLAVNSSIDCRAQLYPGPVHSFYQFGPSGNIWASATFGSGPGRGGNLGSPELSGYSYSASGPLNAGSFTIASSTSGIIAQPTHSITDHTGDTEGRMMIANGTATNTILYQSTLSNLCKYQGYELSAWLMDLSAQSSDAINITFNIRKTTGELLKSYSTSLAQAQSPQWKHEGTVFNIGTETSVIIQIVNSSPATATGNYLAIDDISFLLCQPVMSIGIDSDNIKEATSCVINGQKKFLLRAKMYPLYDNINLQWQVSYNSNSPVDIPGATSATYTADLTGKPLGTYKYNLLVGPTYQGASLYCSGGAGGLAINLKFPPADILSNNGPLCSGNTLKLTAVGPGTTYRWTGPNNFSSNISNPVIANADERNSGTYTVIVDENEGSCSATFSTTVLITNAPALSVSPDMNICQGQSVQLNASGGSSYTWSPSTGLSDSNIPSPVAKPSATTTYVVTALSPNGMCSSKASVKVTVGTQPIVDAGMDKAILKGSLVLLKGKISGSGYTFSWSPAEFLDDPAKFNPVAAPARDMTYTLTAISENGCEPISDQVNIRVLDQLNVPNTFSPNGDGINDQWNIAGLESYEKATVRIYNRFGATVYQSTGYATPWDGKSKSKALPAGNYYYVIDLKEGSAAITGGVLIIR